MNVTCVHVRLSLTFMEMPVPKILLNKSAMTTLSCPADKSKIEYFDLGCRGLSVEVRSSGGSTWYLRYVNQRGKKVQYRIGNTLDIDLQSARQRADELRSNIALGKDPDQQRQILKSMPTFEDFVKERYLPYVMGYKRSWKCDESLLRIHLLPLFGKKYLDEISKTDITAMHHGRVKAGAAKGSANRLLILIKHIFNVAIRWEVPGMIKNPATGIHCFEENNKRECYLRPEQMQQLSEALHLSESTMLKYIVPTLMATGARKREVLDARWEDFDVERNVWRVPLSKSGKSRHVPLSQYMITLLSDLRALQSRWPAPIKDTPYVFPNPETGQPYLNIFSAWNRVRKLAGMDNLRIHDLRHSYASYLVNIGESLYVVQQLLGHTQIKTTQRYAHLSPETLLTATNKVGQSLDYVLVPPSKLISANDCIDVPVRTA